jgi:type IV pilus assembly protein PilA
LSLEIKPRMWYNEPLSAAYGGKWKMRKKDMKKKKNSAFTLVELIAVVAILSILLCIAVPNMMNYINAAHEAAAKTEAQICVDAVQRYLNDEREKGTLAAPKLLRLMSLDLSNSDSPLKDYISGGQKEARIVSVKVDLSTGRLSCLEYGNRYGTVKLNIDEEGNITEAEN